MFWKRPEGMIVLAACLLATGCVSAGKYEQLQRDLDETRLTLTKKVKERDAKIQSLEEALASERAKVAKLEGEVAQLKEAMAAAQSEHEAERAKLQEQLAQTVKDRSRLKASVQDMRDALAELEKRRKAAEARVAQFQSLLARFKPLIDTGKLRVKIVDGRMVVALATDVLFPSGSAKLSEEGKQAITEVAQLLKEVKGKKFQIEGHTDNVPIKTAKFPSNWELAAARAITVLKTMVEAGMEPERLSAASFADTRPAADNSTKEGRAQNRRIEIVVLPDLSTLPGFEELKRAAGES
ncbi:MAG: endoflagellar motor protein [Deltaproteobacteria bacterium]|nr:MAG: endoflagellar motor protein [Deltaproteobacteria bacterium]